MRDSDAGIAQLVEHDLAKVGVASSSLVSRSRFNAKPWPSAGAFAFQGRGAGYGPASHRRSIQRSIPGSASSHPAAFCYHFGLRRGNSSVGRARPCQGRGREFESRFPLHLWRNLGSPRFCFFQRRPGGRVVMQRTANPRTPVRFRPRPPSCSGASSRPRMKPAPAGFFVGRVRAGPARARASIAAPRMGPGGETGRRKGLKIPHPRGYAGSIPAPGTHSAFVAVRCRQDEWPGAAPLSGLPIRPSPWPSTPSRLDM